MGCLPQAGAEFYLGDWIERVDPWGRVSLLGQFYGLAPESRLNLGGSRWVLLLIRQPGSSTAGSHLAVVEDLREGRYRVAVEAQSRWELYVLQERDVAINVTTEEEGKRL